MSPTTTTASCAPPALPTGATRAEIQVIVSLETLLGLTEDPAEVPGLGPVPAEVARALACDGRWRAWVADATGAVTATGTRGYVPSAALARLIRAREPRCRFPGCHQPATRCDLDHAVPWPHGPTTADNLGPLCRRHHNLKTHTPWALDADPAAIRSTAGHDEPGAHNSTSDTRMALAHARGPDDHRRPRTLHCRTGDNRPTAEGPR